MPAFGVQVQFRWYTDVSESVIVRERIPHTIYAVILRLQYERRRHLVLYANLWIQRPPCGVIQVSG